MDGFVVADDTIEVENDRFEHAYVTVIQHLHSSYFSKKFSLRAVYLPHHRHLLLGEKAT
jgi:hypothetical protein